MRALLLVGLGGFLGSIARYRLGGFVTQWTLQHRFPYGTFVVNVLGCLVIGVLAGFAERHNAFHLEARLFLFTGLMGGFTTFSAFGLETVDLLKRGDVVTAVLYVGASVIVGVAAVWIGLRLVMPQGSHA